MITADDIASMRKSAYHGNKYVATIEVDLQELMTDAVSANELIAERAVGDPDWEFSMSVVDFKGNGSTVVILEVTGDVSEVIKGLDTLQLA